MGLHAAWLALSKVGWLRLALVGLVSAPRLLMGRQTAGVALESPQQQRVSPKVTLKHTSRRFAACMSRDDVNVPNFIAAANDFVASVEQFGDFTKRGVTDARKNLRRVEQAGGGRIRSMRQLLRSELQRGARRPEGGPASSTGAEALLWSRLSISLWVEIFKEYVANRNRPSLADATRSGFRRSMGRYFDRFGQAAFHAAAGRTPGWDDVRRRTHLGCEDGVCTDDGLTTELGQFVKDVEPVLKHMTSIQKSEGLEDPRTP